MMQLKLIIFVSVLFFSVNCFASGYPQQEKIIGSTTIEAGSSTENVMPLLLEIAHKKGEYFKKIYGHFRTGYIVIAVNSMGNINNVEEIGEDVVTIITNYYPSSEGQITLLAGNSDLWDFMTLNFKNKMITERNIVPEKEEIKKRNAARNEDVDIKFGLTVVQREQFCHEQEEIYENAEDLAEAKYGLPISGEKADLWIKFFNQVYLANIFASTPVAHKCIFKSTLWRR